MQERLYAHLINRLLLEEALASVALDNDPQCQTVTFPDACTCGCGELVDECAGPKKNPLGKLRVVE